MMKNKFAMIKRKGNSIKGKGMNEVRGQGRDIVCGLCGIDIRDGCK